MKSFYRLLPAIAMIFTLGPAFARAQGESTKSIKKEFTVNADANLLLDNKFGQIHCNNWDKNIVAIEINIRVEATSRAKADQLLGNVTIETESSASAVSVRTILKSENSNNLRLNIDYTINMPATLNLNLTNKFGDVFLNELSGKGNFSLAYGNLEIKKLANSDNVLNIKFGKAVIQSITGAVVSLKYSQLKVDYAGSLYLDSKFSDLDGVNIVSLNVGSEGGKVEVSNTSIVTGTTKFTDLNFNHLNSKFDLAIQYGNCDVENVSADFSLVSVHNKYADVTVNIPSGTSYNLDAELKFCDLDFPENETSFTQKIVTNTSKSIRGTVGKESNRDAKVIVRSEFGNVSLQ